MSWIYVGITAVSTGISLYSGAQNRKAAGEAADAQGQAAQLQYQASLDNIAFMRESQEAYEEMAAQLLGEGRDAIGLAYRNIGGVIKRLPTIQKLYPEGEKLSRQDFDFRTGIQRENLDFILGGAQGNLRESQIINSELSALDDDTFTNQYRKIVNSNLLGLKAATVGEPLGSFANLSARNLFEMSNTGLQNTLGISDFFAREGTVDPVSPIQTTFDLYNVELGKADRKIANETSRRDGTLNLISSGLGVAGNILDNSNAIAGAQNNSSAAYYNAIGQLGGAESYANAQMWNQVAASVGQLGGAYMQGSAINQQQAASNAQIANNRAMTQYYTSSLDRYGASPLNLPAS